MREGIVEALKKVTGGESVCLEIPENEEFGDYATNVALQLKNGKTEKRKNPRQIAEKIVKKLKDVRQLAKIVDKIEVAGPGFINFWLSEGALLENLKNIGKEKESLGKSQALKGKKYLLEHTSPNTIKTLHLGHIRNNVLGMAVRNLLEAQGGEVKLDAINNDRGIHVMKAVWAYLEYGQKGSQLDELTNPVDWRQKLQEWKSESEDWRKPEGKGDVFTDQFYVLGAKAEVEVEGAKDQMQEMLQAWEAGDKDLRALWRNLRDWTFEGFQETYKRLGSQHDHQWFESDFYEKGRKIVLEGLAKGIFKKLPDGAILTNLEKYGLPDAIVLRADGTTMYLTQDLRLTDLKREKFPSDLYIWDIGPEQNLYLQQLFAVCEQLGIGKKEDYFHLSYGYVFLKGKGKMSSRQGTVISADWLMDEMVLRARKIIEESETSRGLSEEEKSEVAEAVGIGAIKYGFLKVARETDIQFDMDESISLEGNSAPYLQYTYARCQSVLKRAKFPMVRQVHHPEQSRGISNSQFPINSKIKNPKSKNLTFDIGYLAFNAEELAILRCLVHSPEVVETAAKSYSPNLVCNYLFDLAQKFNAFYNRHRIINPEVTSSKLQVTSFRLVLTVGVGSVLQNGLNLLGIKTPARM